MQALHTLLLLAKLRLPPPQFCLSCLGSGARCAVFQRTERQFSNALDPFRRGQIH